MKSTTVKASDLGNRLDAKFHILNQEHKVEVEKLKTKYPEDQVIAALGRMKLQDKRWLLDLARGADPRLNQETIDRVTKEYPYLALAIMRAHIAEVQAKVRSEIETLETDLDNANKILGMF